MVESLKGCIRDSSSQKKPRLYGSPHTKNNNIGKPTATKMQKEKDKKKKTKQ